MSHSAWDSHPDYNIDITLCIKQIRVTFKGVTLADSKNVLQLSEQDYPPIYYFPRSDVRLDLMEQTSKVTHCPFKGDASHWALVIEGERVEVAAWSYNEPFEQVSDIKDHIAFYPEVIGEIVEK
jgi:uncharacterized protein (DUF427 family)